MAESAKSDGKKYKPERTFLPRADRVFRPPGGLARVGRRDKTAEAVGSSSPRPLVPKLRLGTHSPKLGFESVLETEFRAERSQTEFGNVITLGFGNEILTR
jgi:hypothetical protein